MAKSKYLTIDVQRSVLVVGTDGYLTEDIRFNRPAKDGETYTSEGIYIFKVTNLYTGETTTKTIYVGSNSYLRALSATGMSIAELNAEIEKGAIVHEDGAVEVIAPIEPETANPPAETDSEPTPTITEEHTDDVPANTKEPTVDISTAVDEQPQELNVVPFVIGAIVIVLIASVFIANKRKKAYRAKISEEEVHED